MGRVVAPCKLGIKPRARVNSFSWARVKGTAEVNSINSTVLYIRSARLLRTIAQRWLAQDRVRIQCVYVFQLNLRIFDQQIGRFTDRS